RFDAFQPLQHFITFDEKSVRLRMDIRQYGALYRVGMQDGLGAGDQDHCNMQQRFRRRSDWSVMDIASILVNFQELFRSQPSLIHRACRYEKSKRIAIDDNIEVAAGAENPSVAMELGS